MTAELPFTGERFVPGVQGEIWLEHWHRYHFAARWVAGRRAVDVACGEGYGTALLARHAAQVTGVDVSEAAVAHARAAYAALPNASFVAASCERLPFPDASVERVVSFETIEHIHAQEPFLDEVARVLRPDGVLLLSCPNKVEYADKRNYANEYHVKELYRDALAAMVSARFPHQRWFGQRPTFYSVIAPEGGAQTGELFEAVESDPSAPARALASPLYHLVAAGRDAASVASIPAAVSVLADRDDYLYNDYAKVIRELRAGTKRNAELEAAARGHAEELARRQHEIERRNGLRWWLTQPLRRLGLLD